MTFAEKIVLLRKNKNYSQEQLAEKLNVSRQAIAKWESEQTFPEINNLIELSAIFNVTIDYLVKDEECMINYDRCDNKDIRSFLLEAKKSTYAAKGKESVPSRPNSHDFKYESGDYLYIDSYVGGEEFAGCEVVWQKSIPVFSMNYTGRVLNKIFTGDFLKQALLNVTYDKPFRGPKYYREGDYIYLCQVNDDIDWFQGYEEITYQGQKIYECYFHGGRIK